MAQKPADIGLFGDEKNQGDLLDKVANFVEPKPLTDIQAANAWWTNELTEIGRELVAAAAGRTSREAERLAKMRWHNISDQDQIDLAAVRGTDGDPIVAREARTWAEIQALLPRDPDGRLVTTEAMVAEAPEDKPAAGGMPPGMGGMGGMGDMGM